MYKLKSLYRRNAEIHTQTDGRRRKNNDIGDRNYCTTKYVYVHVQRRDSSVYYNNVYIRVRI